MSLKNGSGTGKMLTKQPKHASFLAEESLTLFRERRIMKQIPMKGRGTGAPKGDSPENGWRELRGALLFCLFTASNPVRNNRGGFGKPTFGKKKAKELEKP